MTDPRGNGPRGSSYALASTGADPFAPLILDDETSKAELADVPESPTRIFWRQLRKSPTAIAGGGILLLFYGLAILAAFHRVPFFVAAPSSTFALALDSGAGIPIEQRARGEVAEPWGHLCVPPNANVFNPAFDVTPAHLIAAHITERGVFEAPYDLKRAFSQ